VLAAATAFVIVFALFVVATLVLVVVTMRWALRRDRERRARRDATP